MGWFMTDPISSRSNATSTHYDHEAGLCTGEPPASPASSNSNPRTAVTPPPDPQPSRASVDRLVAAQTRKSAGERPPDDGACWRERVLATTACATAVGAALTATTGVGVILAVSAGATCGAKLADAEAACRGK
jgi:hypothetical protein